MNLLRWPSSIVARVGNALRGVNYTLPKPTPPATLLDRRPEAEGKHVYGWRSWTKVTGICLHQTACVLGERPARWNGVGCHIGITRSGKVIWLHDFDKLVVHGNGWNAQTVGIEIDGLYAGIDGEQRTVWDDPDTPSREQGMALTPEAIEAARQTIRWICAEVKRHGGHVRALVAHRQSSATRRNDPGSAIWQSVALPMQRELGLSDGGAGFAIGQGRPIPTAWNASYPDSPY